MKLVVYVSHLVLIVMRSWTSSYKIPSNWLQIEQAIDMTMASNPKQVAVLGVAFKPDTDDLRESPILHVIRHLMLNGVGLKAYDPNIVTDARIEGQFNYIKHAQPELKYLIDNLTDVMSSDPTSMLEKSDCVIVSQKTPEIIELIKGLPSTTSIIDLVRIAKTQPDNPNYQGIGW